MEVEPESNVGSTQSTQDKHLVFVERDLWGGALKCKLPSTFVDLRNFRQIPDHQEVFADTESDESVIIEINQLESDVSDPKAAAYYLEDLATGNEALESRIYESGPVQPTLLPQLPKWMYVGYGSGCQKVSKAGSLRVLHIYLVVIRLHKYQSDILVTFNIPLTDHPLSCSIAQPQPLPKIKQHLIHTTLASLQFLSYDILESPNTPQSVFVLDGKEK